MAIMGEERGGRAKGAGMYRGKVLGY